jgi:uncharacterized OB-fold protein
MIHREATMTTATPDLLDDTSGVQRAIKPSSFTQPFWAATREKKLVIQYCRATGKYQHHPRPTSIFTGRKSDIEWREVSGRGELFSWTVVRRGPAAFRGHEPYVIASVTLDVGVNVIANLVHCSLDQIRIGMKVVPCWLPINDGMHLLMFQPDR